MTVTWPAPGSGLRSVTVTVQPGADVHCVTGGPVDGPPVVFVHGWGIHSYLWRHNLGAFAGAGYRVIAMDLPGHGASSLPVSAGSCTLDALAAHVVSVLDALDVDRPVLVAQSMGGRIALEVARRHRDRVSRLVLFGSVGLGKAPRTVSLVGYVPLPRAFPPPLLVRRWMIAVGKKFAYGTRGTFTAADVEAYWAAVQRPGALRGLRQALAEFDWTEMTPAALRSVAVPALVVFGTRDRTIRPQRTAALVAALPYGRLAWIRDAGHVANEEVPHEANALALEFAGEEE